MTMKKEAIAKTVRVGLEDLLADKDIVKIVGVDKDGKKRAIDTASLGLLECDDEEFELIRFRKVLGGYAAYVRI